MKSVVEVDRQHFPEEAPARRQRTGRMRRLIGLTAGALLVVALGLLISDAVQQHRQYDRAQTSLGVTGQRTRTVSAQRDRLQRDLNVLKTQVGSDTTALNQDASQLLGAQTSLSAAQAHVSQQASLITSLQTCLVGVEQALNELAIGKQGAAIAALNSVSAGCAAAEASSG